MGYKGDVFNMPNIQGTVYAPGAQPYSPGNSHIAWSGATFNPIAWPKTVPVINALANNSGTPRSRAIVPVVDRYAPDPYNYLYLSGVVGKSRA